ncbi:MAG: nucleoside phosphorylase [Magnetococcus sp. WYHC-3]
MDFNAFSAGQGVLNGDAHGESLVTDQLPPILRDKHHQDDSVFLPENLLREARRQKGIVPGAVPSVCLLDPDGDILRRLVREGRAERSAHWSCYHTDLYVFEQNGRRMGIIGHAVGASFAVLLAEQLFVSGCRLLVSMTSAGQIAPALKLPCFILIERALRDEGTSYHYLPPGDFSHGNADLLHGLAGAFEGLSFPVQRGTTWTTDAPYRETEAAIAAHSQRGILAVEMEAAALYAFATARHAHVLCFAHVTNQMARDGQDFEKGEDDGAVASLSVLGAVVAALSSCLDDVAPAQG